MSKIIQFPNQKEIKRKIIPGKILGKRITAEEIELKMNEYSEVFQCTKVGKQIGLKCKNCDAYMQIPVEVFISRKIKCVVCYSTIGDLLSRNELTLDELNAKNEKYTVGERKFHQGKLLPSKKQFVKCWTGRYEQIAEECAGNHINVLDVPSKRDLSVKFECEKCGYKFNRVLSYLVQQRPKITCPRCTQKSKYTSILKSKVGDGIKVLYAPNISSKRAEFMCEKCDSKFSLLIQSIIINYKDGRKITCPYCIDDERLNKIKNEIDESVEIIHIPNARGKKLQKSKVILQCKKCKLKFTRMTNNLLYRKQDEKMKCPRCFPKQKRNKKII